jgi:uncharacterized membrane protein YkvA (DUF1232 family)
MNTINEFDGDNEYSRSYSEKSLFAKIKQFAQKAGINVIYAVLLLYYALQRTGVPAWAKAYIVGSLGYFIFPLDAVPDITPVIGHVDDLGVLVGALVTVAMYIDDEVKTNARKKLKDWFREFDEASLNEIDDKIQKKKKDENKTGTDNETGTEG